MASSLKLGICSSRPSDGTSLGSVENSIGFCNNGKISLNDDEIQFGKSWKVGDIIKVVVNK